MLADMFIHKFRSALRFVVPRPSINGTTMVGVGGDLITSGGGLELVPVPEASTAAGENEVPGNISLATGPIFGVVVRQILTSFDRNTNLRLSV